MRIFRMACFLVLGVLLCLLLIYALGWKIQKPAVIIVGAPNSNMVHPILHIGQVLTWERPSDQPFTIAWLYGEGPCKDIEVPSTKNASGGQTASCKVVRLPPANVSYVYGILEGIHIDLNNLNLTPCWGCTYISENNASGLIGARAMTDVSISPITVACASDANSGSVQFTPPSDQIPGNMMLQWSQVPNVQIIPPIVFKDKNSNPANVTCPDNPLSCNFSGATNYPITYTINATGTTNSKAPAYCGPNNVTGSGTGTVTTP